MRDYLAEVKRAFEGLDERDRALIIAANTGIITCPDRLSTRLERLRGIMDEVEYMLTQEGISDVDNMVQAERTLLKQTWWGEFVKDWKELWSIHNENDIGFWGYRSRKLQPYIYEFGYYYQTTADYRNSGPFKPTMEVGHVGPRRFASWRIDIKSNDVVAIALPISAQIEKGLILASGGRNEEAIMAFNRYIEMKPNDPGAYIVRGDAYDDMGQFGKAIDDYSKSIKLEPKLPEAYDKRAAAYAERGDFEEAIKDWNRAIELYPENAMYYFNMSIAYDKSGDIGGTITNCTKAIELDNNFAKAYYMRGLAYNEKGQYDKAIFDFNKAISLKPDFISDVFFNRGISYQQKGESSRALADYERVLELISSLEDPEDIEVVNRKISELIDGSKVETKGYREEWLQMFIPIYRQADPLIQIIAKLDADGLPADLQALTEASWKLRPILQSAKRLPAPKQKELQNIRKDFENVLSRCIKAGETGMKMLDDISHGAPQMSLRMRLATIVGYTAQAGVYYESLCKRLSSWPRK